jgi:cell division protein FtsL
MSFLGKKRAAMTEFHTIKRIDNSRLVRAMQPARTRDLARTVALWCAVAAFFLCYGYQRFSCIELSFQLEDLKARQTQASATNTGLKLEVAGLRNPSRIDLIARRQLGLTEPLPNQMEAGSGPSDAEVAAVHEARPGRAQ